MPHSLMKPKLAAAVQFTTAAPCPGEVKVLWGELTLTSDSNAFEQLEDGSLYYRHSIMLQSLTGAIAGVGLRCSGVAENE